MALTSPIDDARQVVLELPASFVVLSISVTLPSQADDWLVPKMGRFRLQTGSTSDGITQWTTVSTFSSDCAEEQPCSSISVTSTNEAVVFPSNDYLTGLENITKLQADLNLRGARADRVRVVFDRVFASNTLSPSLLVDSRIWFYFMTRLRVEGVCWCNGHANACAEDGSCACQNNTMGTHCEGCKPNFAKVMMKNGFICQGKLMWQSFLS